MNSIKAVFKLLLFTLWSLLLVPLQIIVLAFHKGQWAYELPYIWERGVCKIFGLKVLIEGTPQTDKQTIYVANHLSYLDIPVIASVLKASFVAKAEVASWPVFGFLSKMQQTAFIQRSKKDLKNQRYALDQMLTDGKSLIIFPEGTSSDGTNVLPFKSSLFSLINAENLSEQTYIQPVTVSLQSVDKQDCSNEKIRDLYAWHGDMTLPPHLWSFAKTSGAVVKLQFHTPYSAKTQDDRKMLAKKCHKDVLNGLINMCEAA